MGTVGELLMELLVAAGVALGITLVVGLICAGLSPLLPGDTQDKLRCPRCYFVGNPGDFQMVGERHQETRTDCGHGHCPCPCQQK